MLKALQSYHIELPDPQLAAAPVRSTHGERYLSAMAAAANFGRANRQLLTWAVRRVFEAALGRGQISVVYDVSHNLAKLESHQVGGSRVELCVHRKGATRALPAGHPDLPGVYREVGQPVLVPGSMGTASYVLVGESTNDAFFSTCHGAGRAMSRTQAVKETRGRDLVAELRAAGVRVRYEGRDTLREETSEAYKDVEQVVRVCEGADLCRVVAKLKPFVVVKG